MSYNMINHTKLKLLRAVINLFLILSYITTFTGCMTTNDYFEFPESMGTVSASEMTKIELKSGELINCTDKIFKFQTGADSVKYIVLKSYTEGKDHFKYWTEKRISEEDI